MNPRWNIIYIERGNMTEHIKTETQELTTKVTDGAPPVQNEHPKKVFQKKKAIFRTHQFIWYILGIIEVLLAFRVALKALGANPFSGFTNLIYNLSDPLALPFRGILGVTTTTQGSFLEWSTLIAALVYALIAYGLAELMQFIKPVSKEEVEQKVDNQ
jgi:uncharacterized protein YggT (Ycf19 family)